MSRLLLKYLECVVQTHDAWEDTLVGWDAGKDSIELLRACQDDKYAAIEAARIAVKELKGREVGLHVVQ